MVRFALLVASLVLAIGASFAAAAEPAAVIVEVYGVRGPSGLYPKPLAIFGKALRERYLSSHLRATLTQMEEQSVRDNEAPYLYFDVVSDSPFDNQEHDIKDLKIATESESAVEAVVVADFLSGDEPGRSVLRYELVREDGAWKIDDVEATGKRHWRVSEVIAGE